MRKLNVGIIGATGAVGAAFLKVIAERDFPIANLRLMASARSAGRQLEFRGDWITVEEADESRLAGLDLLFMTASSAVSKRFAPAAVQAGAVVIDDGSAYRMDPAVPLVVPEVNGGDVDWHSGILSTPNCTTVPLVMALWPEHRQNPLKRVVVSTYQAVSGTGAAAIEELRQQSTSIATGGEAPTPAVYPHQIAFNALPQVDSFEEDGYTKEEHKMANETRKILHDQQIRFSATCVRIPVYYSHSEAVNAEFERPVDPAAFRNGLKTMAGVRVLDDPAGSQYPTPLNAEGLDEVLVGRIRADASAPGSIAFWLACDNIRKGAALNAVQIAETLIARNRL